MRQTRHAAAHAAPSPIPSFLPQPPREQGARPTAAARAAALAEEAEQFLGPRLSEMRIKGSSVMLVNMEVRLRDGSYRSVHAMLRPSHPPLARPLIHLGHGLHLGHGHASWQRRQQG